MSRATTSQRELEELLMRLSDMVGRRLRSAGRRGRVVSIGVVYRPDVGHVSRQMTLSEPIATGELTFINNTVDPGTGTIQLKATFRNEDNGLWPGQFLDAVLTLTSQLAIVVPSQAIQPGQKGPYVFVVKADQTVENRQVQPGARLGAETIITSGLQAGERVVTDGQLRLRPGTKVDVKQ